jgi:hypothetical protein
MAEEEPNPMITRAMLAGLVMLGTFALFVACDDDAKPSAAGEAALATAQFWRQEAAAGVLPEGTLVEQRGTGRVDELEVTSDAPDDAEARFCVEFNYIRAMTPFDSHSRVYVATQIGSAWAVEMVKPDGTCEGVS